jgi:hypothetical protein
MDPTGSHDHAGDDGARQSPSAHAARRCATNGHTANRLTVELRARKGTSTGRRLAAGSGFGARWPLTQSIDPPRGCDDGGGGIYPCAERAGPLVPRCAQCRPLSCRKECCEQTHDLDCRR